MISLCQEHQPVFPRRCPMGTAQPPDGADRFYSPLASPAAPAQPPVETPAPITPLPLGLPGPAPRLLFPHSTLPQSNIFLLAAHPLHTLFTLLRMPFLLFSSSYQPFRTPLRWTSSGNPFHPALPTSWWPSAPGTLGRGPSKQ